MQYIPPGFWSRLTTRILDDENLCSTFSKIFFVSETFCITNNSFNCNADKSFSITPNILNILNETLNRFGGQSLTSTKRNDLNCEEETETSFIIPQTLQNKSKINSKQSKINTSRSNFSISSAIMENDTESSVEIKNGFEWLLWQTGFEVFFLNT